MITDDDSGVRSLLAFSISVSEDDSDKSRKGRCVSGRDPSTHRIIEKRRRDRMNNCLADLSALIPAQYIKQGQARVEKTEIIEMAIQHIKFLENKTFDPRGHKQRYTDGFKDCINKVVNFLMNKQGINPSDPICTNLLQSLHKTLWDIDPDSEAKDRPSSDESSGISTPVPTQLRTPPNEHLNETTDLTGASLTGKCRSNDGDSTDSIQADAIGGTKQTQENTQNWVNNSQLNVDPVPEGISPPTDNNWKEGTESNKSFYAYKYKTDIKQRFTKTENVSEADKPPGEYTPTSDGMSYNSLESSSNFVDSTPGTSSSGSSCQTEPKPGVPGFALHPCGTFYIPIVTSVGQLQQFIDSNCRSNVCYPISIPVNFGGPYVSTKNVVLQNNMTNGFNKKRKHHHP